MTRGGIARQFIAFSIPLLIGNLFQQLYNMADSIIVGNCNGAEALAAVGTSGLPMDVMLAVFLGFSAAATIMVSQYAGAGDQETIRDVVRTANNFLNSLCGADYGNRNSGWKTHFAGNAGSGRCH